jgi:hypothetical protein
MRQSFFNEMIGFALLRFRQLLDALPKRLRQTKSSRSHESIRHFISPVMKIMWPATARALLL